MLPEHEVGHKQMWDYYIQAPTRKNDQNYSLLLVNV